MLGKWVTSVNERPLTDGCLFAHHMEKLLIIEEPLLIAFDADRKNCRGLVLFIMQWLF